jgi:signal transduction histidine kinase
MFMALNSPWPYLATAALVALVGFYALKQPHRPGTYLFLGIIGLWIVSALAAGFETVVEPLELRYAGWALQTIFVMLTSLMNLMFVLEYTGNEKVLDWRILTVLALPILVFGLMVVTMPRTDLVNIEIYSGIQVVRAKDLLRWLLFAANSSVWLISIGVLVMSMLRAPAFLPPFILIILGQAIPHIAFLGIGPDLSTLSPIRSSILFSSFTALAYFIAIFNFRLLRVVPVARDNAIDHLPHAMIVLSAENYLVDFNAAAQELPGLPGKLALRQPADRALGEWWRQLSDLIGPEPTTKDVSVDSLQGKQDFQVYSGPLHHKSGWRMGQVFICENVTQLRLAERRYAEALWVDATMKSREQMANEIHDGFCQNLAFLSLQAQTAQVYLQAGKRDLALESLMHLIESACQTQEETRQMIGNLLAVSLPPGNFPAALHQILDDFEQQTGRVVQLEMDGVSAKDTDLCFDQDIFPSSIALELIRITQEALTNVRKHAQNASQVSLKLVAEAGHVSLSISDDGTGFDPADSKTCGKQFGLQGIQQRAARIGGKASIVSGPGEGTRVEVYVPIVASEEGNLDANSSG